MFTRYRLGLLAGLFVAWAQISSASETGTPAPNQLYGHISENRTLTVASPGPSYEMIGDLTIDAGASLTLEPGVTLRATENSDYLASGADRSQVEFVVRGSLVVPAGGPQSRISCDGSFGWHGIDVIGGLVQLGNTTIAGGDPVLHVRAGSTATLTDCLASGLGTGVLVESGGRANLIGCSITDFATGLRAVSGGTLIVDHSELISVSNGILFQSGSSGDVRACTISGVEGGFGLQLGFSPSPADQLHPEPIRISGFGIGINQLAPGMRLDHMIISRCTYAIHDNVGGHRLDYCTLVDNAYIVNGGGTLGSVRNSILVGSSGFEQPDDLDFVDWWRPLGDGWHNVTVGSAISSYNPMFVDEQTYHLNPASFYTNFSSAGGEIGAYGPGPTGPTPILAASVVDAAGTGGVVRVRWSSEAQGSSKAGIFRRTEDADWQPLTVLYPDGSGYISLEDRDVTTGSRYGYGVGVQRGGQVGIEGEVWVSVEALVTSLRLATVSPNPATSSWSVDFESPGGIDSKIDVLDLSGRVVREVGASTANAGRQLVTLPAQGLSPGMYWIRVRQGSKSVLAKAVKTN